MALCVPLAIVLLDFGVIYWKIPENKLPPPISSHMGNYSGNTQPIHVRYAICGVRMMREWMCAENVRNEKWDIGGSWNAKPKFKQNLQFLLLRIHYDSKRIQNPHTESNHVVWSCSRNLNLTVLFACGVYEFINIIMRIAQLIRRHFDSD